MQKWATQLKFSKHSLYLKIFSNARRSEFFVLSQKRIAYIHNEFKNSDGNHKESIIAYLDIYLHISQYYYLRLWITCFENKTRCAFL